MRYPHNRGNRSRGHRCLMHMEHLSRSLGKHPHRPALCLCRVSRQETGIPHVSRVDRCVCCRLRGQVHDREQLQLYLLQFLSADDRFYFSAAAHTELRTSHTRCPCGCYTLAGRGLPQRCRSSQWHECLEDEQDATPEVCHRCDRDITNPEHIIFVDNLFRCVCGCEF